MRDWAYKIASEAARSGSQQIDLGYYLNTGLVRLNTGQARSVATEQTQAAMFPVGTSLKQVDVRILPTGGTIDNFPPVPRADIARQASWTESQPAVGVYLEVSMTPRRFGLGNGGQPVVVHIFAGAVAEKP